MEGGVGTMKECEIWLENEFYPYQDPPGCIAKQVNKARRQGWRAAMERVMRHEMHRYGNDFMTDKPMNVLYEFIKEELEQ
jgi:hypothetical protein